MRRMAALAVCAVVVSAAAARGQGAAKPDLKWGPAPATFPAGAEMAVVSGDPGQPGPFTIQLSMPDGYKVMPHTHPTDETVTVVDGSLLFGMGKTWDASKLHPIAPKGHQEVKAGMQHFAQAKGKTVIEVSSTGPFAITYVNPADDPSKKM